MPPKKTIRLENILIQYHHLPALKTVMLLRVINYVEGNFWPLMPSELIFKIFATYVETTNKYLLSEFCRENHIDPNNRNLINCQMLLEEILWLNFTGSNQPSMNLLNKNYNTRYNRLLDVIIHTKESTCDKRIETICSLLKRSGNDLNCWEHLLALLMVSEKTLFIINLFVNIYEQSLTEPSKFIKLLCTKAVELESQVLIDYCLNSNNALHQTSIEKAALLGKYDIVLFLHKRGAEFSLKTLAEAHPNIKMQITLDILNIYLKTNVNNEQTFAKRKVNFDMLVAHGYFGDEVVFLRRLLSKTKYTLQESCFYKSSIDTVSIFIERASRKYIFSIWLLDGIVIDRITELARLYIEWRLILKRILQLKFDNSVSVTTTLQRRFFGILPPVTEINNYYYLLEKANNELIKYNSSTDLSSLQRGFFEKIKSNILIGMETNKTYRVSLEKKIDLFESIRDLFNQLIDDKSNTISAKIVAVFYPIFKKLKTDIQQTGYPLTACVYESPLEQASTTTTTTSSFGSN